MDYSTDVASNNEHRGRTRGISSDRAHNGSGNTGVKRQAVSETAQKSQQGSGNGTMTNVADQQTITVTYNFNF